MKGGKVLIKITRVILSIITIALSVYSLISKNFELMPYLMLCLGSVMFMTGVAELQKDRKGFGYMSIVASLFVFFVSVYGFLLN